MKNSSDITLEPSQLSDICSQLASIYNSGIPVDSGIELIAESIKDKKLTPVFDRIHTKLDESGSIAEAMKDCCCFPDYMINMIRVGEKTGNLDEVCLSLADYYSTESEIKNEIRTAIKYPLVLIVMITAILTVLVVKILPVFSRVLDDLGADGSDNGIYSVTVGAAIGKYSLIVVLCIMAVCLILFILSRFSKTRKILLSTATRLKFIRIISEKISTARFASVLSMLISSGYDTTEALDVIPCILISSTVSDKTEKCRRAVNDGTSFAKALSECGIFSGLHIAMINVGVKSGSLDNVLKKLAKDYSDEAKQSVNSAVSWIEPVMITVLSLIIGVVLISDMLPLLGIISSTC